ncbi:MAG: DNA replication and repair protein RecF [bacterium]
MIVYNLALTNFRNFLRAEVEFGPSVNVLFGANGSGKTNLLEAVFVLCLGRSQRQAADAVLLRRGETVYRVEGEVRVGDSRRPQAVAYGNGGRKKITVDGVSVRLSELYRDARIVASGPEDSNILSGPPADRRGFLDVYISQFSSAYLAALTDYARVLAQKNAALKAEADPATYNDLLIRYGSGITHHRLKFLAQLQPTASHYYTRLAGDDQLKCEYGSTLGSLPAGISEADIADLFRARLQQVAPRERAMQSALIGPHRDELAISIGGLPARSHGSQGEWRTAAVALKLGVFEMLRSAGDATPILLLDEIFAELDASRQDRLVDSLGDLGQVFLTTAGQPPESLGRQACRFLVRDEQIARLP